MPSLERISRCFLVTSFDLHSSPNFVILGFLMIFIDLGIHISSVSMDSFILPNSISLSRLESEFGMIKANASIGDVRNSTTLAVIDEHVQSR